MKRLFVLLFGGLLITGLLANPIYPVCISEIYFEGDEWTIELYDYYQSFEEFEFLSISTANDTVYFNENSVYLLYEPILITNENLQDALFINKNEDEVNVFFSSSVDDYYWEDSVFFGDVQYSNVNSPYEGQSLGRIMYSLPYSTNFYLAKENQPSLGENPFEINTRGTLAGYVYNASGNPVQNVEIRFSPTNYYANPFITNENGYFQISELHGMNYNVKVFINNHQFGNVDLTVEPDSTTFHEFYTTYVSAESNELDYPEFSLSNYPNPYYLADDGGNQTTISFSIPEQFLRSQNANISIYNLKGQKLREFKIDNPNLNSVAWNGRDEKGKQVNSGVYFYILELDGREVASNKIIVLK
jgi:hypothetical protein